MTKIKKDSKLKRFERYRKKNLMSKKTNDSSTEDFSSDDESSDEESVKFEKRTGKNKSLSEQYVFMAKKSVHKKNVK